MAAPKSFHGGNWQGQHGAGNQLLNPVVLGHQWLGLRRCSSKVIVRKALNVQRSAGRPFPLLVQAVVSYEEFGGIELGMGLCPVAHG